MSYRNQPQGTYHETHTDHESCKEEKPKIARYLLREFDAFLMEKSAFDNFYSMQHAEGFTLPELNTDEPECFISAGFAWSDSAHGSSYWEGISNAWYNYLSNRPELFEVTVIEDNTRAMAERGAEILNRTIDFIVSSKSPQVATWAAANALGAACCEGMSCSDRAAMLNITPQALSKQTREFADSVGIEPVYGYDKTLVKRELKGASKRPYAKDKCLADELAGGGDE